MPRKPKTPFINRILSRREKLQSEIVESLLVEVAEERDLLEVIFDSMVEGVIALDKKRQVIFYNAAAEALFGLHEKTVLESPVEKILPEGELSETISEAISSGERLYESELRVEEPVERILRVNVIPLVDRLERFFGTVILVIDITEKKSNMARLELAEKLAAQTTLSAGIAHEVRNPLNSLSIHLQLADKKLRQLQEKQEQQPGGPEDSQAETLAKVRENLQVVNDEVERLEGVVKNFLSAVRPQKPNWSFAPINGLVTSTVELLRPDFEKANVRITLEPLEEDQLLPVDENQVRQALINLFRNAIQSMPGGGEIHVSLIKLQDRVRISILDSGEGIPQQIQKRIFEPYFTTRAQGTGLGLAVVQRIVREHRGRMRLQSKPGKGTCVVIDLPRSAEHSKQIPILEDQGEA